MQFQIFFWRQKRGLYLLKVKSSIPYLNIIIITFSTASNIDCFILNNHTFLDDYLVIFDLITRIGHIEIIVSRKYTLK